MCWSNPLHSRLQMVAKNYNLFYSEERHTKEVKGKSGKLQLKYGSLLRF